MKIGEIIEILEKFAPTFFKEDYDNVGYIIKSDAKNCTGALLSLDLTVAVIEEAIEKGCNLIVSHHPLVFKGLKKIGTDSNLDKCIRAAIKNDICIYAIHTNLDNVLSGVNKKIADKLQLTNIKNLIPKQNTLTKITFFVPNEQKEAALNAAFAAGAGAIGNYKECSFNTNGVGTFKPVGAAQPKIGNTGARSLVNETRVEVIIQAWQEAAVLNAIRQVGFYEEVAYYSTPLNNTFDYFGTGVIGELEKHTPIETFLDNIGKAFSLKMLKHTPPTKETVKKIAACGGAGAGFISYAKAQGADVYITGDIKHHDFFEADDKLMVIDIGHFESEQFTIDLLYEILTEKIPNFAILKTETCTNPVTYRIF